MATIQDLYNSKKSLSFDQGGPDAAKVDQNLSIDQTPYSDGTNKQGSGQADAKGIEAVEAASSYSAGNRYGYQKAALGGGYIEWPNFKDGTARATWTDTKKYGDSPRV